MSTTTRPRSRADAKQASREALVEAAAALFSEKGLNVSLDEVCARAGYTRGAFYVHFKDRDALMAAVMKRIGAQSLDALLGGPGEGLETVMQRFAAALAGGTLPISREQGLRPYQLFDACARSAEIREVYVGLGARVTERLTEILRESQRTGRIRADIDPAPMAMLMHAAVIGMEIARDLEVPADLAGCLDVLRRLLAPGQSGEGQGETT